MVKRKLSDILHNNGDGWINGDWKNIPDAPDFGQALPPGRYVAHLRELEPFEARTTGTPGLKLSFEIIEGDYKGRRCWYDIWLTGAAQRQAVRDLRKLGITSKEQLEGPIPHWIRCEVHLVKRTSDQGDEFNKIKTFTVLGIDKEEPDPFASAPTGAEGAST
jgi:hypothetical protein